MQKIGNKNHLNENWDKHKMITGKGFLLFRQYKLVRAKRNDIYTSGSRYYRVNPPKCENGTKTRAFDSKLNDSSQHSFFRSPMAWYANKLETHPLTTKCLTSGFISGSGDFFCQYLVHRNKESIENASTGESKQSQPFSPDWMRTCRFTALGTVFVAPIVHFWYGGLMSRLPGSSLKIILKRLFFDQAFFAPLFLPAFMTNLYALEGKSIVEIKEKLREEYPTALVANWGIWVPAQIINFAFVPEKYMVLFSNLVGFVWNAYLSWQTHDRNSESVDLSE